MIRKHALVVITSAFLLLMTPTGLAQSSAPTQPHPLVSQIFGDNMVLQRGKMNTIWGWSEPGGKVTIEIGGKSASGTVGADHRWQVKIKPPPAAGPYNLRIQGPQIVELHNVLVGDVWLCGGQSNMQEGLGSARNGEEEVKAANFPKTRFFSVAPHPSYQHTDLPERIWKVVSPETADHVSAVAYYFARKVQREILSRSVWLWTLLAVRRQKPGPARRRFVRSRTSMFHSRNWKNCPPPARLNMETM